MCLILFHSWSDTSHGPLWSLISPVERASGSTYFSFGEVKWGRKHDFIEILQFLSFFVFSVLFFVRSPTVSQGQFSSDFKFANCLMLMLFTSYVASPPLQGMSLQANLYFS